MSLSQIVGYYENIQKAKIRELKLLSMIIANSSAFGSGRVEQDDFMKWLNGIGSKEDLSNDVIIQLKKEGIPIEDQ